MPLQVSWTHDKYLGYFLVAEEDGCSANMDIRLYSYSGPGQWAVRCGGLFYNFEAEDVDAAKIIAQKRVVEWMCNVIHALECITYPDKKEEPQEKISFREFL